MNEITAIKTIGVVGTGAVGGFFGAKLALSGSKVIFLSRGNNLEIMKQNGLTLDTLGDIHVVKDAIFTESPADLNNCDLILFTVKSYDTKETIKQIKPHLKQDAIILTPQNGISNDVLLAETFSKERIIPAFAKVGVGVPKPAYIKHTGLGVITFGEYDGSNSKRVEAIKELFTKAGVETEIDVDIQTSRWKKYIWNTTFNIIAAIVEQPLDVMLNNKALYDLCIETIKELEILAIKEGIDFKGEDVVAVRIELARKLGNFKPSTLEDLEKGKPIEIDAFTGYALELAKKHNLKMPINKTLYALLAGKVIQ